MIKEITSADNKIYKQTKKLLNKSQRYKLGLFMAEGQRIVKDAIDSGAAQYLFVSDNFDGEAYDLPTYRVSEKLFSELSDTKTTQGIIAVCNIKEYDISKISGETLLISDGVSDPGNLGTLIRTAECAGAGGVVVLGGTVDPYSPKVVRSTMGSVFRVPVYIAETGDLKKYIPDYKIAVTVLDGSENLYNVSFEGNIAVVVGNEARGVSREVIDISDIRLRIPMCGNAESLNASVAGSIVMYEIFRQKANNKGTEV